MNLKRTIVENVGDKALLQGVRIGSDEYDLKVSQTLGGGVCLSFKQTMHPYGTFEINIRNGKLTFHRDCHRPNHDHDDSESLQQYMKDDKLVWSSDFPHSYTLRKMLEIDFGPTTVGY